jgi:hypothetical protein
VNASLAAGAVVLVLMFAATGWLGFVILAIVLGFILGWRLEGKW